MDTRRHRLLELWPARSPTWIAAIRSSTRHRVGPTTAYHAVHDIVSHGSIGHAFDADSEYSAWLTEDRMYAGLARWALATDLHGEHSVVWTAKDIADHKAVLLDPALLRGTRNHTRHRHDSIGDVAMRIVVIGGTGLIGTKLVRALQGHGQRACSRRRPRPG